MSIIARTQQGTWLHAKRTHTEKLKQFLIPREGSCVTVTEALCGTPSGAKKHGRFTVFMSGEAVESCIFHTPNGFVFPVIPEDGLPRPTLLERKLRGIHTSLFCVMGLRRDVEEFQTIIRGSPLQTVQYYHMQRVCGFPLPTEPLPDNMVVRRAEPQDAEALYPIQREYEIEEVVLRPEHFDATACMHQLKESLKKQLVYVVEHSGRLVAKAQTNARGMHWDQVGGVYTDKRLRGRGIGGAVMRKLIRDMDRDDRSSSLFVKQDNEPALRMYRRLGYSTNDEFSIAYYRGI